MVHDGAPAHWARTTTSYLNANNVNVVDFPPGGGGGCTLIFLYIRRLGPFFGGSNF